MNFQMEDVPSPEDFPPSTAAPGLRDLDEALRCNICKEVYSAPVTIGCGHCFCSLCLRQELPQRAKQECPLCRAPTNESHIRKNTKLEEAVIAWNLARPYILELLKAPEKQLTQRGSKSETPPPLYGYRDRKGQASPKKRKRSPETDEEDIVEVTASQLEKSGLADKTKWSIRKSSSTSRQSGFQSPGDTNCPVCSQVVPLKTINEHMDSGCKSYLFPDKLSKQKQKDGWGKVFASSTGAGPSKWSSRVKEEPPVHDDAEPLPKVSYDTVKQKLLREMLQEHGLPTIGDKDVLIARHQRWVIIYNANLDAGQRKTLGQLRRDLETWERTRQSKTAVPDGKTHEKRNKDVYADLIAKARATAPTKRPHEQPRNSRMTRDKDVSEGTSRIRGSDSRTSNTMGNASNTNVMEVDL